MIANYIRFFGVRQYAAGFPEYGTSEWDNEYLHDQPFVEIGYRFGYHLIFGK